MLNLSVTASKSAAKSSKKSVKKVIAKVTEELMGIVEGDVAIVKKTIYYNGENHYKGYWEKDNSPFTLPCVFFIEEK